MRLICTLEQNGENPLALSYYLTAQGIENECEEVKTPLGKPPVFKIWIVDEDQVEAAEKICNEFKENPSDPRYRGHYEKAIRAQFEGEENENSSTDQPKIKNGLRQQRILSPAPYGVITVLILISVVSIFLWAQFQRKTVRPPQLPGVVQAPLLAPVERTLLFDYPFYFEIRDRLLTIYTPKEIEERANPSPEALTLLRELRNTPVWMGIYEIVVKHFRSDQPLSYSGPLFEKISEGQYWRLFTPMLLHLDLLHIFFNVLWFILLGNQIEFRLGKLRYLLLILLAAIVSNTTQYLMSGPFFMGLSGVVCGLAGFIWARQQVAPWEGYLLNRFTLIFLAIFVLGMFLIQLVFFFLQIFGTFEFTVGIANTAHLSGALTGYLLGRMRFFALRHKNY